MIQVLDNMSDLKANKDRMSKPDIELSFNNDD